MNPNEIADIIERMVRKANDSLINRTYKRGEVSAVSGQVASVYIEGNTTATVGIPCLYSYTPVIGHIVLIVSIGDTGANLVVIGRLS